MAWTNADKIWCYCMVPHGLMPDEFLNKYLKVFGCWIVSYESQNKGYSFNLVTLYGYKIIQGVQWTSTGIDADASKGETSPGYFNSKLVYSYRCGTIFPWEFPEISLAYSHIFMKGPSRSIIYGQIFWHPHPHPHIASPACIYHQNQLFFAFRFSFHLTIHFENAGNICNKIDL